MNQVAEFLSANRDADDNQRLLVKEIINNRY
jgi:hypothetical protein